MQCSPFYLKKNKKLCVHFIGQFVVCSLKFENLAKYHRVKVKSLFKL